MNTRHVVIMMLLLQCGGAVLLAAILGYFHRLYGQRYLLMWSKSWLASAVHLLIAATPFFSPSLLSSAPLNFAAAFISITASYFQVSWLLFGAYEMATSKSLPRRFIHIALVGSVAVALVAVVMMKGDWLGQEAHNLLNVGEQWLITGAAFCLGAYAVFRGRARKKSFGRRLTGLAMIVSGLYQLAYFSLVAVDVIFKTQLFARFHYAMLLDFPLQSAIGLGLVIWLLEEERENALHASDALRESEQQLRMAASAANLDIWEIDVETGKQTSGRYGQVGPPVETYQEFLDLVHPLDRPAVEEAARRAIRESAPFNLEFRIMLEDGLRWLASRGAAFCDESGRAVRVVGAAQDITERKQTEEALRASEARFSKAFNASPRPMGIIRVKDRRFIDVNESVSRMTGYRREEMIGRTPLELNFWTDEKDRLHALRLLEEEGRISAFEIGFRTRGGEVRQGLFSAEIIEIDGERCLLVTTEDITERKRASDALRESESLFRTLAETISAGLYIYRGERYIYVNSTAEKITGYPREELLGMDIWEPFHPDFRETIQQRAIARQRGEHVPAQYEAKLLTKSGEERWVYITANLISYQGEQAVIATSFDITERKRAEEALRASEDRYRVFVTNSSEGIFRFELDQPIAVDLETREQAELFLERAYLAECNEAFAHMYGYDDPDSLIGRRMDEFWAVSKERQIQWMMDWVRAGHRLTDVETRERDREGNILYFLNNTVGVVENGLLMRLWGTQRDVTQRRRTEEALRASEDRYRVFVTNSSEGIYCNELDQPIAVDLPAREQAELFLKRAYLAECNEAFARMYGYDSADPLIGRRLSDFWAAPEEEQIRWATEWVQAGHRLIDLETREQDREGNILYFLNNSIGIVRNGLLMRVWGTQRDVTERRQTEEALRISEERFFKAFNLSPHPMSIATLDDSRYISINESTLETTGYTREEMIGRSPGEVGLWVDSSDRDRLRRALDEEGRVHNLELRYKTKQGEVRDALFSAEIIELDGKPCLLTTTNDITDRKRAEEAVRKSELEYRNLFESANDAIIIFEPKDEIILEANSRACEFYGLSRDELVGMSLKSFSRDVVRGEQFVYQTLRDRSRTGFETVHTRRDGSPIHLMVNGSVIEYGGRVAILSINRDITDRKQVEAEQAALQAALQSAVIEWRQTFDAIRSPIVILDSRGVVRRLNRAAKEMIDRDYGEIIGKDIRLIAQNEPWQKAAEIATAIDERAGQQSCQVKDEASSTIWDITASRASMFEAGEAVIAVARDVTTIFELQESLRRSETMVAMGQLVAGVAHEVRNPLFGISATLDAFETKFGQKPEYQNYLGVLRDEAERLNSLMRELLEYGKPHTLQLSKESLSETVAKAVENSRAQAERLGVRVENLIENGVAAVLIDSERMVQVFQNLIDNAIQHSPRGGVVRIETRETGSDGDPWIECMISDSGPGFRAEDLPNIFKPFFTRRRGGTGLGLSIVQRIIEEHQGGIFLGNREEGGAIVQVRLRPAG
ncbi:MAG: PAS domain S-box protein [Acidobacteriota bacterium]